MFLSVVAMFKNEALILEEWINHYIDQGVDHFYLINNGSTDDYLSKIKNFDCITIVNDNHWEKEYHNTAINKHFLGRVESEWVIICDIDEYIYSREGFSTIKEYLKSVTDNISKIWIPWKIFGSSDYIEQPPNVRKNFIMWENKVVNNLGYGKCICRVSDVVKFDIHNSVIKNGKTLKMIKNIGKNENQCANSIKKEPLHLNHYMHMSRYYYKYIKCMRGGGNSGYSIKYTMHTFNIFDKIYNSALDTELKNMIIGVEKREIKKRQLFNSINQISHYFKNIIIRFIEIINWFMSI